MNHKFVDKFTHSCPLHLTTCVMCGTCKKLCTLNRQLPIADLNLQSLENYLHNCSTGSGVMTCN